MGTFEVWGVVELFGHSRIAGKVTEVSIGGIPFIRVDVPETEGINAYTKYFGDKAIYSILPTGEIEAKLYAESLRVKPVETWMLPDRVQRLMLQPSISEDEDEAF